MGKAGQVEQSAARGCCPAGSRCRPGRVRGRTTEHGGGGADAAVAVERERLRRIAGLGRGFVNQDQLVAQDQPGRCRGARQLSRMDRSYPPVIATVRAHDDGAEERRRGCEVGHRERMVGPARDDQPDVVGTRNGGLAGRLSGRSGSRPARLGYRVEVRIRTRTPGR